MVLGVNTRTPVSLLHDSLLDTALARVQVGFALPSVRCPTISYYGALLTAATIDPSCAFLCFVHSLNWLCILILNLVDLSC